MSKSWREITGRTRAESIKNGGLIDVTEFAREVAGFKIPVALTRNVWDRCVAVPDGQTDEAGADRLRDLLQLLGMEASEGAPIGDSLDFLVFVKNRDYKLIRLHAVCSPGDYLEPVITVLMRKLD